MGRESKAREKSMKAQDMKCFFSSATWKRLRVESREVTQERREMNPCCSGQSSLLEARCFSIAAQMKRSITLERAQVREIGR